MTRGGRQTICHALIGIALGLILVALFLALPPRGQNGLVAEQPAEIADRIQRSYSLLAGAVGFASLAALLGFEFDR